MFALIENNAVTQVGEPSQLFPNTSGANAAYALEQGALEVVEGEQKDQRFYWVTFSHYEVTGSTVTRTYTNTPKALEDVTETPEGQTEPVTTKGLKGQWIEQVNATAGSLLSKTDWAITRKAERDIDVPMEISMERDHIRAECKRVISDIQAAKDMEAFVAVLGGINFTLVIDPNAPKTPDQIISEIVNATQRRLDEFARSRMYGGILSACTYATSKETRFQIEGQYCVEARDATWAKMYELLGEVQAGVRPMPTGFADVEAQLPALVWPVE